MRHDFGNFEEERLGKAWDFRLIMRLVPFMKPWAAVFFLSVTMLAIVTVLELAVPYVTREAIDRYIIPVESGDSEKNGDRLINVRVDDEKVQAVLERYSSVTVEKDDKVFIPLSALESIDKKDLKILRKGDLSGVTWAAVFLFVIVSVQYVITFIQKLLIEFAGQKVMHDLRMGVFKHIQSLDLSYFNRNPVGRLVTRVTNDIQNMQEMFSSAVDFIFKDLFMILGIAGILLVISPRLALVSFTVIPFVVLASVWFSKFARGAFRDLRILTAKINSRISETIQGMRVIHTFRYENENHRRFAIVNHDNYLAGIRQLQVFSVFMPVVELMGSITLALIIYYGGRGVLADSISLGTLVAFISYMKMFFRPIRDVTEKYNVLQNAMSSAERIFLVLDNDQIESQDTAEMKRSYENTRSSSVFSFNKKEQNVEKHQYGSFYTDKKVLDKIRHVGFDSVTFGYNESDPVLHNMSFSLNKGEVLAVVGPTGAGKTSLINLIVGFYRPLSGKVTLNFIDHSSFTLDSVRKKTALVTQDPFLFSGTVRQNILGKNSSVSDDMFRKILSAAHCDVFVNRLENGADTVLSGGGAELSSGERQLISIARAMARNPDLIILDEATSYIDSESELKVKDALENLMKSKTSIIIAHRISTAAHADKIIVLKKGRIVESGNHNELMDKRGMYFKMVRMKG